MYSLAGHGAMISDRIRQNAYAQALRQAIRPGSVVVDLGTGTGIFAVLACQLGASRVFAIESDAVIQVAREIAAANGCADKIEFFEDLSTRVTLPAHANVIVSDLHDVLPLFLRNILSIADARRRFLAPGGVLIPRKDTVWAAVVEAKQAYAGIVGPWEHNVLGQDAGAGRRLVVNGNYKVYLAAEQLLSRPQLWATLDYATVENPDFRGRLQWSIERAGTGHGIAAWFDAELGEGVSFSNAPGAPRTIYGSLFFPWLRPVLLTPGQTVCLHLEAKLVENDYFWRWTTQIGSADGSGEPAASFDQSQLGGAVLSPAKLHKTASDYVPTLSEDGRIHRRTLDLMNGQASLEEISRQLAAEFPRRFGSWQQALTFAGAVSIRHSR
jgi:Ribosomal protein L11 methyltransferase (PrmA)/Arginine methyltransferase oligomerization subdomain